MPVTLRRELWDKLKCLVYHKDIPRVPQDVMQEIRQKYIDLAECLIDYVPEGRSKSLALTSLEDSLMRTIQALALTGTPDVQEPS